ncbi:hypothetical protein J2P12_01025 [Candidatus Bathyarchaeota archaeon]|nr:hypothetical protein [Candidatus Bathyarchaeota archaeon]
MAVKILYLSPGLMADYQCDMLFHGLRTLYGGGVVDCQKIQPLYQGYPTETLYGKGFTLYGLLPDIDVDRSDIPERIVSHEFDLIIYGSIQRYSPYFDLVIAHYRREEILFIDGEDQTSLLLNLAKLGLYFKRELPESIPNVYPIHFAIPASKIGRLCHLPKTRVRAHIDPRDRSTYIYSTEQEYYSDYAQSLFAFTVKKGGWDCLRHYEIMANGCIPLFLDLDQCPSTTCMQLPKGELLEALQYQDRDGSYWDTEEGKNLWLSLYRRIHLKFACHSTTERLADYVLRTQREAISGLERTA